MSKTHGEGGRPTDAGVPEPTLAERARTLIELSSLGTLSTLLVKGEEYPFGSMMPFATDSAGTPFFLISSMAVHTRNLSRDPRCSLLVNQSTDPADALGAARVTLLGRATQVSRSEKPVVSELYLRTHPNARYWASYSDFSFYRLLPSALYMIAGFGSMGWVEVADFQQARPDPLAQAADQIINHVNQDHPDALLTLAEHYAGLKGDTALMTAVDRLGMVIRIRTADGYRATRIPFPEPVAKAEDTRAALVSMLRVARGS